MCCKSEVFLNTSQNTTRRDGGTMLSGQRRYTLGTMTNNSRSNYHKFLFHEPTSISLSAYSRTHFNQPFSLSPHPLQSALQLISAPTSICLSDHLRNNSQFRTVNIIESIDYIFSINLIILHILSFALII